MYCSIANDIEGTCGCGALMSNLRLLSTTAFAVVGPNAAIKVLFCLKSGKFFNNDSIPEGEKNTKTSYCTLSKSDKSEATVLYNTTFLYSIFSASNAFGMLSQIGRASCRERVETWVRAA